MRKLNEILSWVLLGLFVIALCRMVGAEDRGKQRAQPRFPSDRGVIADLLRIKGVDCRYVTAHNATGERQIVVRVIKIYQDDATSEDYLPEVFHLREKAYQACGKWQDDIEREWVYAKRAQQEAK